jgi:hypothetical protein
MDHLPGMGQCTMLHTLKINLLNLKKLLTLLFVIICFNACKKSSNNLPATASSLSGHWAQQSASIMTYTNGKLTNTRDTTFNTTGTSLSNLDIYVYFNIDLSGVYSEPGFNGFGLTYIISGDQLTYTFEGNSNTNAPTGVPTSYTIKKLTSTQLELVDGTPSGTGQVDDVVYTKVGN